MTNPMLAAKELVQQVEKCFRLRAEYEEKKKAASEASSAYRSHCALVIDALENLELTSFSILEGTFSYKYNESYQTPKTPEDKKMLYDYLKSKGIFDDMISVNSKTLNSWANNEVDAAIARGEFNFEIPGISKGSAIAVPVLKKK